MSIFREGEELAAAGLPGLMQRAAACFAARIVCQPGIRLVPPPILPPHPPEVTWTNRLFAGGRLRRAHIETFQVAEHFAVLHACILPHLHDPAPIFGFDMIAGAAQATGIFLDFSPVLPLPPDPALRDAVPDGALMQFARHRERPAWGDIFSADFLAVRPCCTAEVAAALSLAEEALVYYLARLETRAGNADGRIAQGQAGYARAQRQNPHTCRMLARFVGQDAARRFIDEVLFPVPEEEDLLF